jgi:hypothetical protein
VKKKSKQQQAGLEALPGGSALMDRLNNVRRRKRAYGGQVVDMEALRRRTDREQARNRDR